jgi:trehalose 6-phosphate synthase
MGNSTMSEKSLLSPRFSETTDVIKAERGRRSLLRYPMIRYFALALAAAGIMTATLLPLTSAMIEGWSRRDIELRARLVYRLMHDQIAMGGASGRDASLTLYFEQITKDERLLALGFCTPNGDLQNATRQFPPKITCKDLPRDKIDTFAVVNDDMLRIHFSIFPVPTGPGIGHLLVLHDLSYVSERTREAQFYSALAIIGIVIGFGLLGIAIVLAFMRGWNKSVRDAIAEAQFGKPPDTSGYGAFPIGKELRTLLHDVKADRKFAEGIHVEWSPTTLQRLLHQELPGVEILVVSNREPYVHDYIDGKITLRIPAGGLVAALEPVMRACGGTWIAHGSGSADRNTVDQNDRIRVPPVDPNYTLRRVWVSDEEQDGFYYGFANEGLWPLCHIAFVRPTFREQDWNLYREVNKRFAETIEQEAGREDPIVLVQDYQFALLPRMIRERLPKATIITFWHIPWPNAETFGICPWREQIIDGLLGSSILGFHTQFHCNNFLEATDRFMESRIDREHATVSLGGHETMIRPYPISIEWPPAALANQAAVPVCRDAVKKRYGLPDGARIAVGIERFDYTKGILDRIRSIDDLLTRKPELRGKLVFIQAAAPTRSKLDAYSSLQAESLRLVDEVNDRRQSGDYKPIHLSVRHHDPHEVYELFRAADICIVSSLHDGMNLVAKEFVASRDDEQGVLILSGFTGASRELSEALIVNPYDTSGMADVIGMALSMSPGEQRERMRLMRDHVRQRNVYRWAAQMLLDAARLRRRGKIMDTLAMKEHGWKLMRE